MTVNEQERNVSSFEVVPNGDLRRRLVGVERVLDQIERLMPSSWPKPMKYMPWGEFTDLIPVEAGVSLIEFANLLIKASVVVQVRSYRVIRGETVEVRALGKREILIIAALGLVRSLELQSGYTPFDLEKLVVKTRAQLGDHPLASFIQDPQINIKKKIKVEAGRDSESSRDNARREARMAEHQIGLTAFSPEELEELEKWDGTKVNTWNSNEPVPHVVLRALLLMENVAYGALRDDVLEDVSLVNSSRAKTLFIICSRYFADERYRVFFDKCPQYRNLRFLTERVIETLNAKKQEKSPGRDNKGAL